MPPRRSPGLPPYEKVRFKGRRLPFLRRRRKSIRIKDLRHDNGGGATGRNDPPEAPRRDSGFMSYPPLDFFTPLGVRRFLAFPPCRSS